MNTLYTFLGRIRTVYCWLFRPVTLGVKALVLDKNGHILLVEHSYKHGWYLPGGGVDRGETIMDAVCRELREEAAIQCPTPPLLVHGLFYNRLDFKNDHIAFFVVTDWDYLADHKPSPEISRFGFFDPKNLPDGTTPATRRKIEEYLNNSMGTYHW